MKRIKNSKEFRMDDGSMRGVKFLNCFTPMKQNDGTFKIVFTHFNSLEYDDDVRRLSHLDFATPDNPHGEFEVEPMSDWDEVNALVDKLNDSYFSITPSEASYITKKFRSENFK